MGTGTGVVGEVGERWAADTRAELVALVGDARADELLARFVSLVPAGYDELNWPATAAVDLVHLDDLGDEPGATDTAMLRFADAGPNEWRFRVYRRGAPLALADLLPLLDQLGFRALDERAFTFADGAAEPLRLHDVGVAVDPGLVLTDEVLAEVQRTFTASAAGVIEVDGLNRLVLLAGLTARQVEVLRAYARYLRQIGFPFGQQYIEATLCRHAAISARLVDLFEVRFDPRRAGSTGNGQAAGRTALAEALDAVPSLDDDRTLRAIIALIDATVRTNAYRPADDGGPRPVLSFKLDGSLVPDLPAPRPMHEIWVCSPRVEGVHMRHGMIARGGLRWSDRREDFRTEILGLVKAQTVKNAVIVPTGAKGGFVLKRPPADADSLRAEGLACYRLFIGGLLDITDNLVDGVVVPPPSTVRHDADDPYLVVAADKGTASFSDVANEIALQRGFWLGDAFASGGTATTTRRWASPPAAPGRACAATPRPSARTSTAMR